MNQRHLHDYSLFVALYRAGVADKYAQGKVLERMSLEDMPGVCERLGLIWHGNEDGIITKDAWRLMLLNSGDDEIRIDYLPAATLTAPDWIIPVLGTIEVPG